MIKLKTSIETLECLNVSIFTHLKKKVILLTHSKNHVHQHQLIVPKFHLDGCNHQLHDLVAMSTFTIQKGLF